MKTQWSFDPGVALNCILAGAIWIVLGTPAVIVYLIAFHNGPLSFRFTWGDR